jgi:hypothetical protein
MSKKQPLEYLDKYVRLPILFKDSEGNYTIDSFVNIDPMHLEGWHPAAEPGESYLQFSDLIYTRVYLKSGNQVLVTMHYQDFEDMINAFRVNLDKKMF